MSPTHHKKWKPWKPFRPFGKYLENNRIFPWRISDVNDYQSSAQAYRSSLETPAPGCTDPACSCWTCSVTATCREKRIQYKYSAPDHRDVLEILSAALQDLILLQSIAAHVIIVSEKLIWNLMMLLTQFLVANSNSSFYSRWSLSPSVRPSCSTCACTSYLCMRIRN